jgi:hypothetical protein
MKSSSLLFILLVFFPTGCLGTSSQSPEFLLTGNSAGPVKIGETKEQILQLSRKYKLKEVDLFLEGMPGSPAIQLYDDEELLLTAEILNNVVYRIITTSPRIRTQEGIGAGSTFGEVKQSYGKPIFLGAGEGGFYAVFDVDSGGLSFALDVPEASEEHVSDKTKVLMILVTGPSEKKKG